jgi:hypothetical protein
MRVFTDRLTAKEFGVARKRLERASDKFGSWDRRFRKQKQTFHPHRERVDRARMNPKPT